MSRKKAAVFIILGQSNAVGHRIPMQEQDHTYSISNCLALLWQRHIDAGNVRGLPDLYIVPIAVGGAVKMT